MYSIQVHTQIHTSFISIDVISNDNKWKAWFITTVNVSGQTPLKSMGRWPWILLIWKYEHKVGVLTCILNISPKYIETNMQRKHAFIDERTFILSGTLISYYYLRSIIVENIITLKYNYLRVFTCFLVRNSSFNWSDWCFS